jgi:hypothetical protein
VPNVEQKKHKNNCTLIFSGTKEFELDDETSYMMSYIQHVDNSGDAYLTFYNSYNTSIYLYSYESGQFIKKIHYEKEGPDGVGDMQGYFYANDDSIFVYSYWGGFLMHTNSDATVLSKERLNSDALNALTGKSENLDMIYPAPYLKTATPMKKYGNKFILGGFVAGEPTTETATNRPVCLLYDMEKHTVEYIINYPEQYAKYNWCGGFAYRLPCIDLNNEKIIVSFSADHYLTSYSLKTGKQEKHYAGSSLIKGIKSYSEGKDAPCNGDREMEWFMYNPSYQNVLYDRYKKLYYRLAQLPVKDYRHGDYGNKKPTVVTVLDADMNYLGEALLPENIKHEFACTFVSKDGLNIQVLTDNEDVITFNTYNFFPDEK